MRKISRLLAVILASVCLLSTDIPIGTNDTMIYVEAHSGRTDSSGGHRDNKNKSGLGSYHYHCGGYPAHLHTNGVCPYGTASGSLAATRQSSVPTEEDKQAAVEVQPTTEAADVDYSPVFNADYYYNNNVDLQAALPYEEETLKQHFLNTGLAEGRQGCDTFHILVYIENNPDLKQIFGEDISLYVNHYLNSGRFEDRIAY